MSTPDTAQLGALLGALDELRSTVSSALAVPSAEAAPSIEGLGPLATLLVSAQQNIVNNPSLAAGVVQTLTTLGRSHATTPHGAALLDQLVSSNEIAKLRELWEAVTLNLLDEVSDPSPVPAAWMDLILDGLASSELTDTIDAIRPAGFA